MVLPSLHILDGLCYWSVKSVFLIVTGKSGILPVLN